MQPEPAAQLYSSGQDRTRPRASDIATVICMSYVSDLSFMFINIPTYLVVLSLTNVVAALLRRTLAPTMETGGWT